MEESLKQDVGAQIAMQHSKTQKEFDFQYL
jgi:hypothetical protein